MRCRVAEPEAEQICHYAAIHSVAHARVAFARGVRARQQREALRSSLASAHTAAPRTSADGSSSKRSASAASATSPELPIAISTLRTKRSRPVRLTGDFANNARNDASSSRASSASFGARRASRADKLRLAAGLRELVPRTNRKAVIAAVNAVAHLRAQLARDRAFVLDGEIRDAAPRIEPIGRRKRICRTDIKAGPARAAMVDLGRVRLKLERAEDRAEKQPRAVLARHEIGVLALPAEPGRGRERFLHHGRGIDEHLHVAARVRHQPARDRLELRLDEVVIVVALRVDRDRAERALLQDRPAGRRPARSSGRA